jgi:thiosulfate/3-mercaptopyruvate sulfurtransferase
VSLSATVARLLLMTCSPFANAQRARTQTPALSRDGGLVVSASWLASHLHDSNLVIRHLGEPREYAAKHLPGARFVSLSDISSSDHSDRGLSLEMPATERLHAALQRLGISNDWHVVYYAQEWVPPSTRVIFTLDYAGLGAQTSLLAGGMEGWAREGHPLTSEVPTPHAGKLAALATKPIIVTADYMRAPSRSLVSRSSTHAPLLLRR